MFDFLGSYEFFTDTLLIQAIAVLSFYVVFQAGLLSLGSVGLMAVGGYTSALLVTRQDWPIWLAIAAATVMGTLFACLFGIPVLRLKGIYLALGSLALAQALVVGIANFDFTNGALGISAIPRGVSTGPIVVALIATCVVLQLLHRSHFGRAYRAMRIDERTAEGLGINLYAYKMFAFALSGALAGLSGALEAHRTTVISPDQYSFNLLVVVLTYAIVGGSGHWIGPLAVTVALGVFRDQAGAAGTNWENIMFGVLLVAVMVLAPHGASDRRLWRRLRDVIGRADRPATAEMAGASQ